MGGLFGGMASGSGSSFIPSAPKFSPVGGAGGSLGKAMSIPKPAMRPPISGGGGLGQALSMGRPNVGSGMFTGGMGKPPSIGQQQPIQLNQVGQAANVPPILPGGRDLLRRRLGKGMNIQGATTPAPDPTSIDVMKGAVQISAKMPMDIQQQIRPQMTQITKALDKNIIGGGMQRPNQVNSFGSSLRTSSGLNPRVVNVPQGVGQGQPNIDSNIQPPVNQGINLASNSSTPSLGYISAKYESGGDPNVISSGVGDPGGVSYGPHQLASKTGTLQRFLGQSAYASEFKGLKPGSDKFDRQWTDFMKDPKFRQEQFSFINNQHYRPVRKFADKLGIPNHPAINEALFSMGVQHGGAKKIINRAGIKADDDISTIVNKLYDSRINYVRKLRSLSPQIKNNIINNRYRNERQDILRMID